MKLFEEPILKIALFAVEDIVTTSDPDGIGGNNELEEDYG